MKVMFASDIHGSLPATEALLARFTKSGARWLVLLGDFLYHGPRNALPEGYNPAAVAERLNTFASRIIALRGNCDSEVDQMLLEFPITAPWQHLLYGEQRMFLTHSHLYGPDNLPPLEPGDIVISGHTHIPVAEQCNKLYFFNPGSISIPKGGFAASYGLFEAGTLSVRTLGDDTVIAQVRVTP